jgi:hypothetical protein
MFNSDNSYCYQWGANEKNEKIVKREKFKNKVISWPSYKRHEDAKDKKGVKKAKYEL